MGKIECELHGDHGIVEVCQHIWEDFQNEMVTEMLEIPILKTQICKKCFTNTNVSEIGEIDFEDLIRLPKEKIIQLEKKIITKYDHIIRKGLCTECIKSIKLFNARKNGMPLPFEPFENTLLHKDGDKIESLKNILLSNYDFQNFKNPYLKKQKALILRGGGISYPLSISMYYVTDQEDQNRLLKLIEDFFKDIPQKQRKISFYESDNWISEEEGNTVRGYSGEKILLLEKIVK